MKCEPTSEATAFQQFATEQQSSQFLQSWDWGEFQMQVGRPVRRWIIRDDSQVTLATAQVIIMPLPAGRRYYYLPRGPVFRLGATLEEKTEVMRTLIGRLRDQARNDGALWLRLETALESSEALDIPAVLAAPYAVRPLRGTVQPETTQILSLAGSEEELLSAMHPKTRYNIRLAEKKGVRVTLDHRPEAFDDFWKLMRTTALRNKITNHPKAYYQKMYETLCGENRACRVQLYRAEFQGRVLSMIMTLRYGNTLIYLHGASSNEDRNVMAPYLIQWQAIRQAKHSGAAFYDFWGVTTSDDPDHHWAGITKFKKGFGGRIVHYAPAADIVFRSLWYRVYGLLKKITK